MLDIDFVEIVPDEHAEMLLESMGNAHGIWWRDGGKCLLTYVVKDLAPKQVWIDFEDIPIAMLSVLQESLTHNSYLQLWSLSFPIVQEDEEESEEESEEEDDGHKMATYLSSFPSFSGTMTTQVHGERVFVGEKAETDLAMTTGLVWIALGLYSKKHMEILVEHGVDVKEIAMKMKSGVEKLLQHFGVFGEVEKAFQTLFEEEEEEEEDFLTSFESLGTMQDLFDLLDSLESDTLED